MSDTFIKVVDAALRTRLYYKFKDILSLTSVSNDTGIFPKEIALRQISEKRGKVEMEFINIWRQRTLFDWKRQQTVIARRGIPVVSSSAGSAYLKAVPAKLEYKAWFWSKDKDKLNSVTQTYMLWHQDDPNLDLYYNDTYPLELDLHFGDIEDESPIEDMFNRGLYFVISCPITIDSWIFSPDLIGIIETIYLDVSNDAVDEDGVLLYSSTIKGSMVEDTSTGVDSITKT